MTSHTYQFGPFTLLPAEHLLLRDGTPVTLTPKAFDTLCVLVERQGHLVTTQELLDLVWPGTFVEPNNLAQQVSALRRALAESEPGLRCIETVPRRGYRFVAPVVRREADGAVPAAPVVPASAPDDPLAEAGFTRPTTRYALSGDTSIAYQVLGDGHRAGRAHRFVRAAASARRGPGTSVPSHIERRSTSEARRSSIRQTGWLPHSTARRGRFAVPWRWLSRLVVWACRCGRASTSASAYCGAGATLRCGRVDASGGRRVERVPGGCRERADARTPALLTSLRRAMFGRGLADVYPQRRVVQPTASGPGS